MARIVNEVAAELRKDRHDRFGFLATMNLPDVDGSINEVECAYGELQAAGVIPAGFIWANEPSIPSLRS